MPRLKVIDRVTKLSTTRVLAGGAGRIWFTITLVGWLFKGVRWLAGRNEMTIREELEPGDTLLIEHSRDPLGKRPSRERI
ncbi:MAG TPA: hypothetical protein VMY88_03800 [Acidimicrobiales bacterium]|nr:hypothetical protein [Acidimicrobiales bacterium]